MAALGALEIAVFVILGITLLIVLYLTLSRCNARVENSFISKYFISKYLPRGGRREAPAQEARRGREEREERAQEDMMRRRNGDLEAQRGSNTGANISGAQNTDARGSGNTSEETRLGYQAPVHHKA
jgi:hypothetical protein